MNSDMGKPEKFAHLYLVYHFKVPLTALILHKTCRKCTLIDKVEFTHTFFKFSGYIA